MLHRTSMLVLLAGLVALAALGLGCGSADDDEGALADVDAAAVLDTAAARMLEVGTFHFEVAHEHGSTPIVGGLAMTAASGDVQGDARMRLQVNARFAGTNVTVNIVVLPDASYLSNPITGRWEQQDIDITDFFDPSAGVPALMRGVDQAKVVAAEQVRGRDTYVVEATVDSGDLELFVPTAAPGRPVPVRVWVGVDDPVVYRVVVEGPLAPDDADNVVRRLDLSAFDRPVEITAPE